jgi:peptidoglycan/LPS O-acetylase OafA/YrhL
MQKEHNSPNLDILRTVAVSLVLFSHVLIFWGVRLAGFKISELGILGVLLFFTHTSIVLMFSLERQQSRHGNKNLFLTFIWRRVFRIYPLSILAVTVAFLFKLPLGLLSPGRMLWADPGHFGFLSNLLLVQNLTSTPSIVGPLWSLPFEMQMYLVLPILFLLARKTDSTRVLLLLWLAAVAAGSFGMIHANHSGISHGVMRYKYIPNFLAGVIAYSVRRKRLPRLPSWGWPVLLLAAVAAFILEQGREQGWIVCLIVGLAVQRFQEIQIAFWRRFAQITARYSYGIYVTHYFAIWLAFVYCAKLAKIAQWMIFAATLLALCPLLYHLIEEPMIRLGNRIIEKSSPMVAEKRVLVTAGE